MLSLGTLIQDVTVYLFWEGRIKSSILLEQTFSYNETLCMYKVELNNLSRSIFVHQLFYAGYLFYLDNIITLVFGLVQTFYYDIKSCE